MPRLAIKPGLDELHSRSKEDDYLKEMINLR